MNNLTGTVRADRVAWIDFLKVFLCIGIVLRHAELVGIPLTDTASRLDRGMMLFSELFVPMFFVLSGFLFFRNVPPEPSPSFFWGKLWKRVFSLLIPYLIANVLAWLCYWAAYRFAPSMMAGFLGDNWKNPLFVFWTGPVNLSLWFIRDLFIAVLCAPLTWILVRYTRFWGVLALGLVWYFMGMRPWYNFYFTLGAWAAVWHADVASHCQKAGPWLLLVYICTFAAAMKDASLTNLSILSGLPLLVALSAGACEKGSLEISPGWQAWCFFMYLYHYIPELVLKRLCTRFCPLDSSWQLILAFLAITLLTLALVSAVYYLMKKTLPGVLQFVTGGK